MRKSFRYRTTAVFLINFTIACRTQTRTFFSHILTKPLPLSTTPDTSICFPSSVRDLSEKSNSVPLRLRFCINSFATFLLVFFSFLIYYFIFVFLFSTLKNLLSRWKSLYNNPQTTQFLVALSNHCSFFVPSLFYSYLFFLFYPLFNV